MALRIAGAKKPAPPPVEEEMQDAPVTEEMPTDVPTEEPPASEASVQDAVEGAGVLDPVTAGYKGPEQGPFMCANCKYFSHSSPNTCSVVAGFIDEAGLCNVFSPLSNEGEEDIPEAETPQEEMAPEEEIEPAPEEGA
jgi:hypothetical protein